ncbi:TPA: ABC transporter permease [Clostridioides difficile]|nr:ABC transporter permease [Clostridioides difficile]
MNELKPYIKFFNKNTKLYIIIFMIVGIVMNILPVFILKIFGEASKTNLSTIVNPILTYITILLFVYGVNIANKDFSGALSIRADRKSCIKAIVIDLIILSFVISILGIVLIFLSKLFIEIITGYSIELSVLLKRDMIWTSISALIDHSTSSMPLTYLNYFVQICINEICIGFIGVLLGAFTYRVRKVTSITILIGLPILMIIYIVNFATKNMHKMLLYLEKIIYSFQNPFILFGTKVGIIVICIIFIILLLRKAPIKEYANDLL